MICKHFFNPHTSTFAFWDKNEVIREIGGKLDESIEGMILSEINFLLT